MLRPISEFLDTVAFVRIDWRSCRGAQRLLIWTRHAPHEYSDMYSDHFFHAQVIFRNLCNR